MIIKQLKKILFRFIVVIFELFKNTKMKGSPTYFFPKNDIMAFSKAKIWISICKLLFPLYDSQQLAGYVVLMYQNQSKHLIFICRNN
jgi:hypothetical protein